MASQDSHQLHFIFIPFPAQGRMIPMFDMAHLFARRGVQVTIITTTLNAARFKNRIDRAIETGLRIQLAEFRFPCQEADLPDGSENVDVMVPELLTNFINAVNLLQQPIEKYLQEQQPCPSCIISDSSVVWTCETASKLEIPRIFFHGMCCFSLLCWHNTHHYKSHENVASESEPVAVPGLPHRIEIPKSQLRHSTLKNLAFQKLNNRSIDADAKSYGVVVNSFFELENEYLEYYEKAMGKKVWTVGPVSLCNKEMSDKAARGNKASINEHECLSWLNSRKPKSVVYVCFGSQCRHSPSQLIQIGLGLEASNQPFVWVIRDVVEPAKVEEWLSEGFEERIKERGLIIKGWAPQLLILSHPAIGGFLTHCGWNSTLESICAGVPVLAWPLFGEQFLNEKYLVQVLRIGVDLGIFLGANKWERDDNVDVLVKMETVKNGVERLMDEGDEGEERRKRAREFGEKASRAMEEGGSSYINVTLLIEDIMDQARKKWPTKETNLEINGL
ncbi:UDP-glycosyltransferase 73C12-like [Magnolia sinica]|uniref:UDP-glycosyltransferase 73C12-like n=1 Tax=Magnolia sinica TaxID=86752 RepID=UPI0026589874|nr:UDP-glycosyltransferase 73C12-like [Magnolia sinica]